MGCSVIMSSLVIQLNGIRPESSASLNRGEQGHFITRFQDVIPRLVFHSNGNKRAMTHGCHFWKLLFHYGQEILNAGAFRDVASKLTASGEVFEIRIELYGDVHSFVSRLGSRVDRLFLSGLFGTQSLFGYFFVNFRM